MTLNPSVTLTTANPLPFLTQTPALRFGVPMAQPAPHVRLIRLDEINEEGHQAYRQALANVYASLDPEQPVRLLYLLDGGPTGVNLYFGVMADAADSELLHGAMQNLRGALEGQLPGINFGEEIDVRQRALLLNRLCQSARQGVLLGIPTGQEQNQTNEEMNFQDMDRLVRALQSGSGGDTDAWQLAIVSQPLTRQQIQQQLDSAYALSSQLTQFISTNVQLGDNTSRQSGTSSGSSDSHGTNDSTSKTRGGNYSYTEGDNKGDTRGKSDGGSEGKNWGKSSSSTSSGSSEDKNWGTNTSKTTGTNTSKTAGSSTSDSDTKGTSFTRSTNEGSNQSDTSGHSLNVSK